MFGWARSLSGSRRRNVELGGKGHGAAFATYRRVETGDFVLMSGADYLVLYQSSPEVTPTFCKHCESTLQLIYTDRPGSLWLALATLDDDSGVQAEQHIFVGSKAIW